MRVGYSEFAPLGGLRYMLSTKESMRQVASSYIIDMIERDSGSERRPDALRWQKTSLKSSCMCLSLERETGNWN